MRRDPFLSRTHWPAFLAAALLALPPTVGAADEPEVHALVGARIVQAPGQIIESGTLVLRDGLIEAVGANVEPPADARIWQLDELTLYPGLIESFHLRDWPEADEKNEPQAGHENALVTPERDMLLHAYHEGSFAKLREAGFTTAVVAPKNNLFRGTSVLLNLGPEPIHQSLLRRQLAHNVRLTYYSDFGDGYPSSTMGAVALFRQTLLDARWHTQAHAAFDKNPRQKRPLFSTALSALEGVANGSQPVVLESNNLHDTLRLAALASEFGLDATFVATGDEYRRLEEVDATGASLILPINFPKAPKVKDKDNMSVSLEALRHWDRAPDNPRLLAEAGVDFVLTSHKLSDAKKIHGMAAKAIERGFSADQVLAALTTTPAARLGIDDRAGSLDVGKMANLVVTDGDLFSTDTTIRSVWVDGRRFEIKDIEPATVDPLGTWEVTAVAADGSQTVMLTLEGSIESLTGSIGTPLGSLPLSDAYVSGDTVEVSFDASALGLGNVSFSMTIDGDSASGSGITPQGPFEVSAERISGADAPDEADSENLEATEVAR